MDSNAGNLPRLIKHGDKALVVTVGPSELQGPPGSSYCGPSHR